VGEELELIGRMRAGNQQAFDQFFKAYAARLAGFAARRSALDGSALEDVVQLTMINAMRNLASFRGESALFTWLCQICRNQLVDARRKAARQPVVDNLEALNESRADKLPIQLIDYHDPLDACTQDSERAAVRRVINDLPVKYSRILELRFGDDLSIAEIAHALGLTEVAAQSLLARARGAFRGSWTLQSKDDLQRLEPQTGEQAP
jgi:RNA polymerase sigma-70 factor, ECF subfamily